MAAATAPRGRDGPAVASIVPGLRTMPRDRRPARGSIHPLLDLHGLTADDALRRARSWLREQRRQGVRTVVLVTGRGNRSAGPPVLRTEVEHLLSTLRGDLVAGWEAAAGCGAFQVRLTPPVPATPSLGERDAARRIASADPALRARAAEALAELGITPTPALLDAQIRRLLDAAAED